MPEILVSNNMVIFTRNYIDVIIVVGNKYVRFRFLQTVNSHNDHIAVLRKYLSVTSVIGSEN